MTRMSEIIAADEAREAAEVQDVKAARRRLRSEPVATWRASVEKFGQRVEASAANVRDLQSAFEEASRDVARGKAGAEERQSEIHTTLVNARNEHERAVTALTAAKSALAESEQAAQIVRTADFEAARQKEEADARAVAARDVARLDKALKEFCDAHRAVMSSVGTVVGMQPVGRDSRAFDLAYAMRVCYVAALPFKWLPKEYDFFVSGMRMDPHSSREPTQIPGLIDTLSAYT